MRAIPFRCGALLVLFLLFPVAASGHLSSALSLHCYESLLCVKAGWSDHAAAGSDFVELSGWDRDGWDEDWDRVWDDADSEDSGRHHPLVSPRRRDRFIEFRYVDEDYEQVYLLGDFNHWEPEPMELDASGGIWFLGLDLDEGEYHYQFLGEDEEGSWEAIDPGNTEATRLDERGWVSVLDLDWRVHDLPDERRGERRRIRRELERSYDEDVGIGYQRVDGLTLDYSPDHVARYDFEPSFKGSVAYGFESERWSAGLTVIQPLSRSNRAWLRLEGFTGTDFNDQTGIGELENSLGAVFFRTDLRDYFDREGAALSLVLNPLYWLRLEGGARTDDFDSLENVSTWSFASGAFKANPAVDVGTLRAVFTRIHVGTRENYVSVDYEQAGESVMGGEFEYELITAEYRGRLRMGPDQALDFRVKAGSNFRGQLPRQRRYLVGGLGTVRGYKYQSLLNTTGVDAADVFDGGERALIFNTAYHFDALDELALSLLFDAGMAWADRDAHMELEDLMSSAGLGLDLGDGFSFSVMKGLDRGDRDPEYELRLQRTF